MLRRRSHVVALAALAALGIAGCGRAERQVIDRMLAHPVRDADVTLHVAFTQAGNDLLRLDVAGPYHDNGAGKLPSFDLGVRFGYTVLGDTRTLAFRAISNGTNVFVRHDGETFQVGEARVARFLRQGRRAHARTLRVAELQREGLDLGAWFPDAAIVGDELLRGEAVTHLTGHLDVSAALNNLAEVLEGKVLRREAFPLTPALIERIDALLTDPQLDLYVANSDGSLRRLSGSVGVDPPGIPLLANSRLTGSLDLRNVGEPNTITAPSGGRPITELLRGLALELGLQADPSVPAA